MKLFYSLLFLASFCFAQTKDTTRRTNNGNPYPQEFFGTAARHTLCPTNIIAK